MPVELYRHGRRIDLTIHFGRFSLRMTRKHTTAALWQHRWAICFVLSIAAGIIFRLIWLRDMEYKEDEAWTFTHVQSFWQTHDLRSVGMDSSARLPNGGMSLWIFIALSSVLPLDDPLALARAVELVNIVAILVLAVFALRAIEPVEREPWLWSVALVSVNPLTVLFSRKIWPQDVLPVFTMGMLIGWWHRGRWWGAFFWGLLASLLGQIHLAGFLFCAAFLGCTLLFQFRSVRWSGWFVGSIAGSLPLIPWLLELGDNIHGISPSRGSELHHIFIRHWVDLSLGTDLGFSLGHSLNAFLAFPTVGGIHLYLGKVLLYAVAVLFLIILARLAVRIWARRHLAIDLLFGVSTPTALALFAAFWGYGLALLAINRDTPLHYFIITFSLPMVWLARLEIAPSIAAREPNPMGRILLGSLVFVQACLTIAFLSFIHETRVIEGDYGVVYDAQYDAQPYDAQPQSGK